MVFELSFRFALEGGAVMSDRSKQIAARFLGSKEKQQVVDELSLQRNKVLDEGYSRLCVELKEQFNKQCEALNQEPEIGNILVCDFGNDMWKVTRTDLGLFLLVKPDAVLRSVSFKCDKPVLFKRSIETKLMPNGESWWYADKKGSGIASTYLWLEVEKAINALLGIGS